PAPSLNAPIARMTRPVSPRPRGVPIECVRWETARGYASERMGSKRAAACTFALALVAAAFGFAPSPARGDFGKDEKKFDNLVYPAAFRARVQQSILRGSNWLLMRQK